MAKRNGIKMNYLKILISSMILGAMSAVVAQAPVHTIALDSAAVERNQSASNDGTANTLDLTPEQRMTRMENQLQYLTTLTQQIKQQQQQIIDLNGQVEDLQYQVKQLHEQQKSLDATCQRLRQLKTPEHTGQDNQTGKTAQYTQNKVSRDKAAYDQAFAQLTQKKYTLATQSFTKFTQEFPQSDLIGNAHYWLGELYLSQGKPDMAAKQFRIVIRNPEDDKIPEAMFKLANILLASEQTTQAKAMFRKLAQNYRGTHSAELAEQRLKTLK